MARNATTQETALQTALSRLSSVKTDPALTKGRTIITVDHRMDVKKMPIGRFLTFIKDVNPIQVQRNDLYRLNNGLAKHLEQLQLPQCCFALVFFDGQFYLVDGNTRKRSWLSQTLSELPSHVFVAVMAIDSLDEGVDIYNCYDSKQSKKTMRDELLSLLHNAGVEPTTLLSKLVAGGKLVSVLRYMTRALSGGSASPKRRQQVVQRHAQAFRDLDLLQLDEGQIPGGAVWALLRLYQELPREFATYVDGYAAELKKLGTPNETTVASSVAVARDKALERCKQLGVGTSGEKPIPVMFGSFLLGFVGYAKQLSRKGQTSAKFSRYLAKLERDVVEPDVQRVQRLLPQEA